MKQIATKLRRDSIEMTTIAKSGHPTSCLSIAEIMSVLFFSQMKYDVKNPQNPNNDEFILSKGHASPILYSALHLAGAVKEPLKNLRKFGSMYEGHPTPHSFPWAKVATGSLGQGLSVGVGMALGAKKLKQSFQTYVLCGDGEVAEGSIYEAIASAVHFKLDNLTVIIDINRFGLAGKTMLGYDLKSYSNRFRAFGCKVVSIDGHSISQIKKAFQTKRKGTPLVILAKTVKGKGVSFIENDADWHGKVLDSEQCASALRELPLSKIPKFTIKKPTKSSRVKSRKVQITPKYTRGDCVATRVAYGEALKKLAEKNKSILAVDAEVKHSTFAERIEEVDKDRFIEAFIAEQNMVGMSLGLASKGYGVYASTFAAFFTRAHDQLRIASLSNSNVTFVGSHAGVSIGEDGPTQMGLEDIAMFRAMPNSTVFYPSDAVSTEKIMELTQSIDGVKYIRTSRPKTPVLYKNTAKFTPGDFGVVKKSSKDKAVVVGAGITVAQAIEAVGNDSFAIVDCYSIKPFNAKKFITFVKKHGKKILVVEDHYAAGGIGEMISAVIANEDFSFSHLCVGKTPQSGSMKELLSYERIDSKAIKTQLKKL